MHFYPVQLTSVGLWGFGMMPALTLARRIPAISLILSTCSQLLSSQQKYRGKI